jgi:hypothetical protein
MLFVGLDTPCGARVNQINSPSIVGMAKDPNQGTELV